MEREISAHTGMLGLLGHPVGHSVSPYLQNRLAELHGLDLCYLAWDVEEEKLEDALRGARAMGVRGMNVTVPHKQAVRAFLAAEDESAARIGAVNTLKNEADGWHGYNTDMPGFLDALADDGVELKGRRVVVLGAGGAANAILCGVLASAPEQVLLYNRSADKAEALLGRLAPFYPGVEAAVVREAAELPAAMEGGADDWIAVQTTSLGMAPHTESKLIADNAFYSRIETGYDIVFNPADTAFMKAVREAGAGKRSFNGLKMLLYQGIRSFEIWTGAPTGRDEARSLLPEMAERIG
ncbi:MAG: shikimate dehydrogenase [Lachnospiraceae bacterium]|nr:shikimate dehydrogenase [Lachnospiraceae bacterium]